jgi:CheY-like chemotaxis protein
MSEPISLVLYGRNLHLLDTRRRLLQEAGYQVWTAAQIPEVFAIITEERIDVLILCRTLSPEERAWALAFADVQSPPMRSIVLIARKSGYRGEVLQNVLDATDGPADLLAALESLVSHPSSAHFHTY